MSSKSRFIPVSSFINILAVSYKRSEIIAQKNGNEVSWLASKDIVDELLCDFFFEIGLRFDLNFDEVDQVLDEGVFDRYFAMAYGDEPIELAKNNNNVELAVDELQS
jgi:hypothetical protein